MVSAERRIASIGLLLFEESPLPAAPGKVRVNVYEGREARLGELTMDEASFEAMLMAEVPDIRLEPLVTAEGTPSITLAAGVQSGDVTPDELRKLGLACLAAADEAESDALIFAWLRETTDIGVPGVIAALADIRNRRKEGNGDPRNGG